MKRCGSHEGRAWPLDEPEAEPIVRLAVEGGVTFFNTAHHTMPGDNGRSLAQACTRLDLYTPDHS